MKKEVVTKILNKVKRDYSQIGRVRKFVWPEERALLKYIRNKDSILDLGCGEGRIIPFLKNKKINYLGLDNCSALLKIAQAKFPEYKFINQDLVSLDLPKESFDVVLAIAVLHHIPSNNLRLKILKDIRKLLRDEGLLIMTNWDLRTFRNKVFAEDLDRNDYYVIWRLKKKKVYRYYHLFTKNELSDLLKKAKFKIVKNQNQGRNIVTIAKS